MCFCTCVHIYVEAKGLFIWVCSSITSAGFFESSLTRPEAHRLARLLDPPDFTSPQLKWQSCAAHLAFYMNPGDASSDCPAHTASPPLTHPSRCLLFLLSPASMCMQNGDPPASFHGNCFLSPLAFHLNQRSRTVLRRFVDQARLLFCIPWMSVYVVLVFVFVCSRKGFGRFTLPTRRASS